MNGAPGPLSYVLPVKWDDETDAAELADLTAYLRRLRADAAIGEVVVVDGSPTEVFDRHARAWADQVTHVQPDPALRFANGKVDGVTTGVGLARSEKVVIADDDVRWDAAGLRRVVDLLDAADLVRPQNHFAASDPPDRLGPLPWHARWDTARSLLNRAVARDYPGTFGLRRSTFVRMGGYDGDVLFENLELIRTVRAAGGREVRPLDLYVARRPPSTRRFLGQRVRQAYDDLAQPGRLLLELTVLPATAAALVRRPGALLAGGVGVVAVAEAGRRRAGGRAVYPASAALWAPPWVLERGVCVWLAVGHRLTGGGVHYAGRRLRTAAHPSRQIRRRLRGRVAAGVLPTAGSAEAGALVTAVAEGPGPRPAAAAQRHRPSTPVDRRAVLVDEPERSAHDQRPVPVRRDDRDVLVVRSAASSSVGTVGTVGMVTDDAVPGPPIPRDPVHDARGAR